MEQYNDEIYGIFRKCFPELAVNKESFLSLLSPDECRIIMRRENGEAAGCAAIKDSSILLLCVSPEHRGKGIGSSMLRECEEIISSSGGTRAYLGGNNWLFLGAVLSEKEWERLSSPFFDKRGYIFTDSCTEMSVSADKLSPALIPQPAVKTEFRFIKEGELGAVLEAVSKVKEDWCRYFTEEREIYAGFCGGVPVSFCIAEDNCTTLITGDGMNIGSVGCVGTIPEMRRKGIGLAMVGKASMALRRRGCSHIYIHYTSVEQS